MNETFTLETKQLIHDGWKLGWHVFTPHKVLYSTPVLCLHGFAQSHKTWTAGDFAQTLARLGFVVYCLDWRGHGNSEPLHPQQKVEQWGMLELQSDLEMALQTLSEKHPQHLPLLIGHSLGGLLAIQETMQRNYPLVVLLATPLDLTQTSKRLKYFSWVAYKMVLLLESVGGEISRVPLKQAFQIYDWLYFGFHFGLGKWLPFLTKKRLEKWIAPMWHHEHMKTEELRDILQSSCSESTLISKQLVEFIFHGKWNFSTTEDWKLQLHKIKTPLLCFMGEDDFIAPPETGIGFFQELTCDKKWFVLPKTGHIDITSGSPSKKVLQSLIRYLESKQHF